MASDTAASPTEGDDAELKALLATMTDPRRANIVNALLATPGMGSSEIAGSLGLLAPTVRKQLRALMEMGLVEVRERKARRGVQKLYFVASKRPWITMDHEPRLSRRQRQTIDIQILREIVADAQKAIGDPRYGTRPDRLVARVPGPVDERGWREVSELQHELLDRLIEIVEAAGQRLGSGEEEPITLTSALLLLELPHPVAAD